MKEVHNEYLSMLQCTVAAPAPPCATLPTVVFAWQSGAKQAVRQIPCSQTLHSSDP